MQYANPENVHFTDDNQNSGISRQRGATLMEIILYLAVAAIIAYAVFSLFTSAFGGSKAQAEAKALQGVVSGVQSLYGTQRVYGSGNLIPALIKTKAAPSSMIVPDQDGSLRNVFGGLVTVTGANNFFSVSTASIPARACAELAQINVDAVSFTINGTSIASPAPAAEATNLCQGENNTLAWTMR